MKMLTPSRCLMFICLLAVTLTAGCRVVSKSELRDEFTSQRVAELNAEARAAREAGDLDKAMQLFRQALELDQANADAALGVGDIHETTGDYEQAAQAYETARDADPTNYTANYKLGLMYHLLNRLREAVRTYLAALTINPSSIEANLNLATAYLQLNQPQLALPYARHAVELDPDNQSARVNLGAIYAALGRHENALQQYRAASEISDEFSSHIALNLAGAELKVGSPAKAARLLNTLAEQDPTSKHYERLGYALFKQGAFKKSLTAYEKSLQLNPANTAALNGRGVILMTQYIQTGRNNTEIRNNAIESWQKSVRLNRDQPKILDLISRYARL